MSNNVLIIAGEASGDLHGASLIRELNKLDSSLKIFGIGGNKMQAEGMELIFHIDKMAFLGFVEVIKHLSFIKKIQARLLDEIQKRKVKHVILIDYPGFNLSIAKKIKTLKPELILTYYITPQVWAWGKGRVKKLKNISTKFWLYFLLKKSF